MNRLLIANRGEIARRIIRTAHRMGLQTVAVYSDADANALHVREATLSHALRGNTSAETYLDIGKIIDGAKATGADAVHPGYGFLSENADFAQAVVDAGLVWVGPPARAIHLLGSKSAARRLAREQGVPCLPGYDGEDRGDEALAAEALRIGVPLMVKASAGGGGRGMRLVTDMAQFADAVKGARSEALAAFGSGSLILERALLAPRHVEVQVFADSQGSCIHLGERDCSVQRRHQKIIEESPSPAVDAALRERMGRSAVQLAQAAGYVGAGTVEFLVEGGEFYMMEMNTRLQVEHPVTEMITRLDLVEWQIRVARGEPLPLRQEEVHFSGHAIEVRLCAEDENCTPHTGTVLQFDAPDGVRMDHALEPGTVVTPFYDSMLAKLVVHAATREEAIDRMAGALDRLVVLGLPSNRAFLAACLRQEEFRAGEALVPFLARHGDAIRVDLQARESAWLDAAGLSLAAGLLQMGRNTTLACPFARPVRLRHRGKLRAFALDGSQRPDRRVMSVALESSAGSRWHLQDAGVDLFIDDASFDAPQSASGAGASNELRAPFNGRVVAVRAAAGDPVSQGDVLVVLESMKLEHALSIARAGRVAAVNVAEGQQVAPGQLLVSLEPSA